jgi:hypothetical protein
MRNRPGIGRQDVFKGNVSGQSVDFAQSCGELGHGQVRVLWGGCRPSLQSVNTEKEREPAIVIEGESMGLQFLNIANKHGFYYFVFQLLNPVNEGGEK